MHSCKAKVTVYFEPPYWTAVFERWESGELRAAKLILGAELGEAALYEMLLGGWAKLKFSPAVAAQGLEGKRRNPKRQQREVRQELAERGTGTKAQQALKLEQERLKARRKQIRRERTLEEKQRQFYLRQQKRKEKHKGR